MSGYGSTGHGDQTRQTDEYGNPIKHNGGEYGTGGNTGIGGEYGTGGNRTGGNTGIGGEYGTGGNTGVNVTHNTKDQDKGGITRRSNSSSSSSEDDEQGGRRKKSIVDKVKQKLPGGKKEHVPTTGGQDTYGQTYGADGQPEKKGFVGKVKEKLPGGNKEHSATTGGQNTYDQGYGAKTATPQEGYGHGTHGADQQTENKGFIEKIKEKLPGGHQN